MLLSLVQTGPSEMHGQNVELLTTPPSSRIHYYLLCCLSRHSSTRLGEKYIPCINITYTTVLSINTAPDLISDSPTIGWVVELMAELYRL